MPWEVMTDDGISNDRQVVLETWKSCFESLYKVDESAFDMRFVQQKLHETDIYHGSMINEHLNRPLEKDEVTRAITGSKNGKAVGCDMIPNELLKNDIVVKLVYGFLQLCFANKLIPDCWRRAIIHPIPKEQGTLRDPLRYRGIALQCCMYKVLSNVLNHRISDHLEKEELLAPEQNGFRKGRLCQHHIYALVNTIQRELNCGREMHATFVDFQKAFDLVNRPLMFCKLMELGINGIVLELIKSMYRGTENVIHINELYTPPFMSELGVRQGNNLSPKIFTCYINGLLEELRQAGEGIDLGDDRKLNSLAYADDIIILANSAQGLQHLLDVAAKWCSEWQVIVNSSKTKVMHFRNKRRPRPNTSFSIDGNNLEIIGTYKYLGLVLSENLDMCVTVENMAKAGTRALGQLIGKTRSNYDLGYNSFTTLFNSCVIPVLDYGVGAWHSIKADVHKKTDQIQQRAVRYYCGLPRSTPILGLNADMGWIPGEVR